MPINVRALQELAWREPGQIVAIPQPFQFDVQGQAENIAKLKEAGYRVKQGDASDGEDLDGKWWWTLSREGWSGVEASLEEFATEAEAWADASRAYRDELAAEAV